MKYSGHDANEKEREYAIKITCATNPFVAFKLGKAKVPENGARMRADWEEVKDEVMRRAIWKKFTQNPDLRKLLLETGDAELYQNSPYDTYWGIGHNGKGKNMLGIILMETRQKLRDDN